MHRALTAVAALFFSVASWAGTASLSWTAPTQNTDGSPLTNLAGYRVYEGCNSAPLTQIAETANTSYVRSNIPDDGRTCSWAVSAFNTLNEESVKSNSVSKTFEIPPLSNPDPPVILNITFAQIPAPPPPPPGSNQMAKSVLLVVGDAGSPTSGDAAIKSRFEAKGHTVTYISDDTSEPSFATYDIIVISESTSSGTVGTKYTTNVANRPVLLMEHALLDEQGLAASNTSVATTTGYVNASNEGDSLAVGLLASGNPHTIFSASRVAGFSSTGEAAGLVDVWLDSGDNVLVGYVPRGGTLVGGGASPNLRVFAGFTEDVWNSLNSTGLAIFDAIIDLLVANAGFSVAQISSKVSQTSSATSTLSGFTPTHAGSLLVLTASSWRNGGGGITSIASDHGTWQKAVSVGGAQNTNPQAEIWYCENASQVTDDIVLTGSASTYWEWNVTEVVGAATSSSLDKIASDNSNSAAHTSQGTGSTGTLSQADEIAFAVLTASVNDTNLNLGGGLASGTLIGNNNNAVNTIGYRSNYLIVSATDSLSGTFTHDSGQNTGAVIATFKKAGASVIAFRPSNFLLLGVLH